MIHQHQIINSIQRHVLYLLKVLVGLTVLTTASELPDKVEMVDLVAQLRDYADSRHQQVALDNFLTIFPCNAMRTGLWFDLESSLLVLRLWFDSLSNEVLEGDKLHLDAVITMCSMARTKITAQKVMESEPKSDFNAMSADDDTIWVDTPNETDRLSENSEEYEPPTSKVDGAPPVSKRDYTPRVDGAPPVSKRDYTLYPETLKVESRPELPKAAPHPTLFAFAGTLRALKDVREVMDGDVEDMRVMMLDGEFAGREGIFRKWRNSTAIITIEDEDTHVSLNRKIGVFTKQWTRSLKQITGGSISLYELEPEQRDMRMIIVDGEYAGTCAIFSNQRGGNAFLDIVSLPTFKIMSRSVLVPAKTRVVLMD